MYVFLICCWIVCQSFVWSGGHLSCSFTCWVFLCLFILFILLYLGWPFCILAVGGVLFIAEFRQCEWDCMGGLPRFLVREACVSVLVGGAGFFSFWSAMKCPVMSYEMSVGLE